MNGVEAAKRLAAGVPAGYLEELVALLGMSERERREVFGLSKATWSRRRRQGRLKPREAEIAYRLARLYGMALFAFGEDQEAARAWMRKPHPELSGMSPMEAARLEPAAREAEAILVRAEAGVPV